MRLDKMLAHSGYGSRKEVKILIKQKRVSVNDIIVNNAKPLATVEQAFFAEALGYASNLSQREDRQVKISEIIPDDLKDLLDTSLDFQ